MRLKIYTEKLDREYLKYIPLAPMVYPFFADRGNPSRTKPWQLTFKHYWESCQLLFELSSLADSQIAIFPYDWFWVRSSKWLYPINSPVSKEVRRLSFEYYQKAKEKTRKLYFFSQEIVRMNRYLRHRIRKISRRLG